MTDYQIVEKLKVKRNKSFVPSIENLENKKEAKQSY